MKNLIVGIFIGALISSMFFTFQLYLSVGVKYLEEMSETMERHNQSKVVEYKKFHSLLNSGELEELESLLTFMISIYDTHDEGAGRSNGTVEVSQ
ncbi:MAG: hypothetical protein JJU29_22870 [Verrucomicrobia bacterium]|nr:hypothetical protein [Verrucomicrobiota bacterium]MCH8514358.1 hypothetical protein [Kiritimatiellia bacterium]